MRASLGWAAWTWFRARLGRGGSRHGALIVPPAGSGSSRGRHGIWRCCDPAHPAACEPGCGVLLGLAGGDSVLLVAGQVVASRGVGLGLVFDVVAVVVVGVLIRGVLV